jgi:hypothetical protein
MRYRFKRSLILARDLLIPPLVLVFFAVFLYLVITRPTHFKYRVIPSATVAAKLPEMIAAALIAATILYGTWSNFRKALARIMGRDD